MQPYTKEYFTWKGVRDEMIALKKAYGDRGVPKDIWEHLEGICKQAVVDMSTAAKRDRI